MAALEDAPAVVVALLDDLDHLVEVLADVAHPEVAGLGIERHPPRIPEAVRPQLAARAGNREERIVLGNGVAAARIGMFHVDPDHAGIQVAQILSRPVPVGVGRAVARGDIQHPVGTEPHLAAVVAVRRPFDHEMLGGRVDLAVLHDIPEDAVLLVGLGVGRTVGEDVDPMVLRILGMEVDGIEP
jgi:hypothetical protein